VNGLAAVSQAAEHGLGQVFIAEQQRPLIILKIRSEKGGLPAVALLHQFEEDVGLLGTQIDVSNFVNEQKIEAGQAPDELTRGVIGDRSIHLIEQILGFDEQSSIAIL